MKLFLILYTLGHVGGVAGPLPYDMAECENRIKPMNEDVKQVIATGRSTNGKNEVVEGKDMEVFKTMHFVCEYRPDNDRPKLGDKEPQA